MHWVLKLLDQCGLDEQHIRGSATSAFMRTKLGFVSDESEDVRDFFERPLFQLIVTALPASSGCAASISARVIAPIEGARFVYDKKPLQKPTYVLAKQGLSTGEIAKELGRERNNVGVHLFKIKRPERGNQLGNAVGRRNTRELAGNCARGSNWFARSRVRFSSNRVASSSRNS